MSRTVKMRNLVLGEGRPKICVPIVGRTLAEVTEQMEKVRKEQPDMAEWRMDFLETIEQEKSRLEVLDKIRETLGDLPLLCTFRTKSEGGEREVEWKTYMQINESVLRSGKADAIDVELFAGEAVTKTLIADAHQHGVAVIGSNHDFQKTPEKDELLARLCAMQQQGMDVAKIAVMPQDANDVLALLEVTLRMKTEHPETPVITMSMGKTGLLSRLSGELFGSAVTFGCVGKASAPGQIPVEQLRKVLELLG